MPWIKPAATAALISLLVACGGTDSGPTADTSAAKDGGFEMPFEKYTLDNGLEVVLHQDTSDPIVAIATIVNVGSNREVPGRTGFAHFFEHMSFNDSENVPRGANRKMIEELGGIRNGATWNDGTIYFEVVPKDAFEKLMWIDSDRLGYMINTVTEAALEREKQVVKNEKRQRVDNAPYGHTNSVIRANLYPQDHPYNWDVIGSLPDLQAATLDDVKEFYEKYYGAANATLAIVGDIDIEETKQLVDKWFGEIRRGPDVPPLEARPVSLEASSSLYHEDNFAKLPELRLTFPTVENLNEDSYPLDFLGQILAGSKQAPLYKVIVEEKKLAPRVQVFQNSSELAGTMTFWIRANAGVDLDEVKAAVEEGLARFEQDGISETDVERIKAELETDFYNQFTSVLNKAFQLANYNEYAGDPGYASVEAERMQAVTKDDIQAVYDKYIKGKPYVMTSFVPQGQAALAVEGAEKAEVFIEEVVQGAEGEEVSEGEEATYEKTPTKTDRSEPPLGEAPLVKAPVVWTADTANGMKVYGTESSEVPLVTFSLSLKGGHWLDPLDKAGVATLLAELLMQGTEKRTAAELEEAIGLLGSTININAGNEEIEVFGNCLARNFDKTVALVEEILLEPRWDEAEYQRLISKRQADLKAREGNPQAIARTVALRLLYGDDHIMGTPAQGTLESVGRITLDDLKGYYASSFSPSVASFHVVGDVSQGAVEGALSSLSERWAAQDVTFPEYTPPTNDKGEKIFFIDVPGSKQSVINVAKLALKGTDEDYNNLNFANQRLGGGSSARLFQLLRIQKGYTYGAGSGIMRGRQEVGPFMLGTAVRANVTLESLQLIRDQLENYSATFTEDDAELTRNQTLKANARAFEALFAKLNMLRTMSKYDLPADYPERDQEELRGMDLDAFRGMIDQYMDESEMFYLVVGDGATQRARVGELGYGSPVELDIHGNPVG